MIIHPSEHCSDGHRYIRRFILFGVRRRALLICVLPLEAQRTQGQVEQILLTWCAEAAQNRDEIENILRLLPMPPPHIIGVLDH
jgi:hypothetical protein